MLKISVELCLERAREMVSGLENLTNLPSVKLAANQLEAIQSQIAEIEISQLTDLSSDFLANESL